MNMRNKYLWVAAAVAAILALWAVTREEGAVKELVDNLNPSVPVAPLSSASPSVSVSASTTPKTSVKATAKPTVTANPTYGQLITQYAGRRIQFDQYCQANPRDLSLKSGTAIMLDNRSGDARTVKVGSTAHYLAGYGYKIVTVSAPASQLPKSISLSCGAAVNVGTILLQK